MGKNLTRKQVEEALGWEVERLPIQLADGTAIESHYANARMLDDNRHILGVVGKGYRVIQNSELLDIAEAIRKKHKLKFTSAGVVGDGERVYFQCSGNSFFVGDGDEVTPYMLFINAHDGSLACRMNPMTERIECENQLGNIMQDRQSYVSIRHAGDVQSKLEEAGRLGSHFLNVCDANRKAMLKLRKKQVTSRKMADFFQKMYVQQIREVTINPEDRSEDLARNRADIAFQKYKQRFEKEAPLAGTTAWNMANAYTGWRQHDHRADKDPERSKQRRRHSALFGIQAQRSVEAFQAAMTV